VGFRPPGAPSKNPATACKAEKKKRCESARTLRKGDLPAVSLFDDDGACFRHEACIAAGEREGKCGRAQIIHIEKAATCSYIIVMTQIPIREAKNKLTELARRVEAGEAITVTRNGRPVMDLVPATKKGGIDWEGLKAYKKEHGITDFFGEIPKDFDDPLPEDFLITPLPPFLVK